MSQRGLVLLFGISQLLTWGVSFYLIGVMGERIALDTGWSGERVYGGFSVALLTMGLASPWVGALIDRHGGRPTMCAGSALLALGCLLLAMAESYAAYLGAWLVLGLAMRFTLYDAAFASLARILGAGAKRPIGQLTLIAGLSSSVFWPFGHALAEALGWRGAVFVYAAIGMSTLLLHLAIPTGRVGDAGHASSAETPSPLADAPRDRRIAGALYAVTVMAASFLASAMSSHMIALLSGLGLGAATAVWASTLRGIGQTSARLMDVLFGARLHPLSLNLGASLVAPLCFVAGFFSGELALAALVFAFAFGASNGLLSITRGTVPLTLFDPRSYGALSGRLLAPAWILSASAPVSYAFVIERFGASGGLILSIVIALMGCVAAAELRRRYHPDRSRMGRSA